MSPSRKPARAASFNRRLKIAEPAKTLLETVGRLAHEQGLEAYAVGGCVRDWWLGLGRVVDVDVTVEGDGIALAKRLGLALGIPVASHEQFGTATIEWPIPTPRVRGAGTVLRLDVASCRREAYAEPAAYPRVSAGSLADDLFRRDFTINAMAMAIAPGRFGRLVDPYGGLADLAAKRLRILHPRSFLDDPSRILRAARFAQRYGLSLEPKTSHCLRQAVAADALARLNRGRLQKELERMLGEPDPVGCLVRCGTWLLNARPAQRGRR